MMRIIMRNQLLIVNVTQAQTGPLAFLRSGGTRVGGLATRPGREKDAGDFEGSGDPPGLRRRLLCSALELRGRRHAGPWRCRVGNGVDGVGPSSEWIFPSAETGSSRLRRLVRAAGLPLESRRAGGKPDSDSGSPGDRPRS